MPDPAQDFFSTPEEHGPKRYFLREYKEISAFRARPNRRAGVTDSCLLGAGSSRGDLSYKLGSIVIPVGQTFLSVHFGAAGRRFLIVLRELLFPQHPDISGITVPEIQ
jgi:hypothetical protein